MNTAINWKLIYEDTFDSSRSVDKTGTDITDGFYFLWFFTLLESVQEISQNVNGTMLKVPGKGFNFFTLTFEQDDKNYTLSINIDRYLSILFRLKGILLANYDGIELAAPQKTVLAALADSHRVFNFTGKEENFYQGIEEFENSKELSLLSLKIGLDEVLDRYGLKLGAQTGVSSSEPKAASSPGPAKDN